MRNILIVVDMQNDFIDGSLGTKEAQEIVTPVAGKIRNFEGDIYGTLDTHEEDYLSTQEGKNLLRGTVLIHDLRKHIVGNSDKKHDIIAHILEDHTQTESVEDLEFRA